MLLRELGEEKGIYVGVLPYPSTDILLRQWAEVNGLEPLYDYHVTVLYSRRVIHVDDPYIDHHFVTATGLALFGGCLVLTLNAPSLTKRHEDLIAKGASHDFPAYQPHITLGKANVLPNILLPNFGLVLGSEYSMELDDGFR